MEVMHFDSASSTPFVSAPTSPSRFDYYCHYASAPTSPTRAAAIYASSVVPFDWEETPGTPKSVQNEDYDEDYVFEFSGQLEKGVLPPEPAAADELFEQGKIRPLKPPPRLHNLNLTTCPKSPRSPRGGLWSPRHKKDRNEGVDDPFAAAMAVATRERGRVPSLSSIPSVSSRSKKGSRSLSPMRGESSRGLFLLDQEQSSASSSAKSRGGSGKKWRLRDWLLFRSASEGRATGTESKDPLRKFSAQGEDNSRSSSFRSVESIGSSMRRGSMSPHEMHYTSNRAASEEMRKKTALPFSRQGLFGCLRFNPAVQTVARGFSNSSAFDRRRI